MALHQEEEKGAERHQRRPRGPVASAGTHQQLILAFADDLAVAAASKEELVAFCGEIERNAARFGLKISPKTEYMVVSRRPRDVKEIRELSGVQPILNATKNIRLQYHGHLARGTAPASTRAMLETSPHAKGSRPRGPPPCRLRDQVAKDAAALGIEDWREEAQDRTEWRNNTKRIPDFPDPYEERRVQAKRRKAEREAAGEAAREHSYDPA
ncbi:Putative uncharacterized transposon-derived protein [Frankliniella fusca]|uniref:Uncharacterized transposon-derived protein n=1 Tax=Frankliniella fusca TaxID=407009 RepID=A0AAE1HFA5_9NEOP|nr:Putative uncharacterized transposon-derived protein [Frankliniella fusca]